MATQTANGKVTTMSANQNGTRTATIEWEVEVPNPDPPPPTIMEPHSHTYAEMTDDQWDLLRDAKTCDDTVNTTYDDATPTTVTSVVVP